MKRLNKEPVFVPRPGDCRQEDQARPFEGPMEGGRDALCARLEWQVSHVNYIAIERVCDGSDVEVREALQKHVLVERGEGLVA